MRKWTITSLDGQVLFGEETPKGEVNMTSKAGNHGQYTIEQWNASVAKMAAAGYKVEVKE